MRRFHSALALIVGIVATRPVGGEDASRLVRDSAARTPEEERAGFHLPEGFEIQLFADDALLGGKPVNMAFDARGRLWVTCTREYPYAVKKEKWSADTSRAIGSKDSIRILEDTDGDGRADKTTVFADDLNIPTGIQPIENGCIAWSIPNILFLEDTRAARNNKLQNTNHNDPPAPRKADKRTILFGPLGYERDTHGMISSMRLGLDGWIYATHGFSNTSHFQVRNENLRAAGKMTNDGMPNDERGSPRDKNAKSVSSFAIRHSSLDITSGSVFRFKPDGSEVELWTSGQVNPFGLCWDSWGNLYSADCHSSPIYQLIRGATYPQFGKPADALGFGPAMCDHAHGSTGIAGIVYIDAGVWGKEWDDHMFVGNPVSSKVNHDFITFTGSTPKANEQPDFLTSDDGWFRPVDLQLGPDGALYIADFYNRIIGHYEVPLDHPQRDRSSGRIWRVVRKGYTGKLADCDLTRFSNGQIMKAISREKNITRSYEAFSLASERQLEHPSWIEVHDPMIAKLTLDGDKRGHANMVRNETSTLIGNPNAHDLGSLLFQLGETSAADTHLTHALRIALRSVMQLPGAYGLLSREPKTASLRDELIGISCAVQSTDAAIWLLDQLKPAAATKERDLPSPGPKNPGTEPVLLLETDRVLLTQVFTHIARHLPSERAGELVELVQQHFGDDLDTQLDLFTAVWEGEENDE